MRVGGIAGKAVVGGPDGLGGLFVVVAMSESMESATHEVENRQGEVTEDEVAME